MGVRLVVVAGASSGVGKTTVTLGLLEALRRRGLTVQAFKVGPDFIDPGLHEVITGRPSFALDGWMCGREAVLATVGREASGAEIAVIEGVMGCFDGADATGDDGSTAQVAKWLGAPVVLVIDASGQSRSAAATVLGFERFDPELNTAGVIVNRVGGEGHARWLADAIGARCRAVPLGFLARDEALAVPERHLGLVTAIEGVLDATRRTQLARAVERGVDLDRLLALAAPFDVSQAPLQTSTPRARIGVARDAAFQFYYAENLARLRAAGAELVFWSPLVDAALPAVDALYLGGGYPELHAARLAGNEAVRAAVSKFVSGGRPVYAECGGLMYLAETLEDQQGVPRPMVGVLPITVRMQPARMTLGYREVRFVADTPLAGIGATARGHEFHYSTPDPVPGSVARAWRVSGGGPPRGEGYLAEGALMTYLHLHFASCPDLPHRWVEACAKHARERASVAR